jgi:hypothetical protein
MDSGLRGPPLHGRLLRYEDQIGEYLLGSTVKAKADKPRQLESGRLGLRGMECSYVGFPGGPRRRLSAGYGYSEVKCLGCATHQTVSLDIVRRPKRHPSMKLERYMRCKLLSGTVVRY